ncbi:MAG: sigma-54 dependent transcriptional regulator [Bryobacteraceae bacterium]
MKVLWIASRHRQQQDGDLLASLSEFSIEVADGPLEGLGQLRGARFDTVVANFPLPGWTQDELLEELRRIDAVTPVLIRDAGAKLADAVRLTKLGAFHFLDRETPPDALRAMLTEAVEYRRSRELALFGDALSQDPWRRFLVGESQAMKNVAQVIRLVSNRRATVLIGGETGTGKEMVARALHLASGRAHLPMVAINCSALPESLLEAELFGHVRGAFTGAINQRVGRFEQAHRSTLFLDEIGDMPLETQAKLLRVLQEREFQRVGSSETVRVDVRVIAACNVDLVERIGQGRFREDLYYRLNVVPIQVPALRDRLADIPQLALHFVDKICRQEDLPAKRITPQTLDRLRSYSWPGNVRQLENAVEMAIALSGDRDILFPSDFPLPSAAQWKPPASAADAPSVCVPDEGLDFERIVGGIERSILDQALRKSGGNKKQAAELLHLKRTTLAAKLKSLEAVLN